MANEKRLIPDGKKVTLDELLPGTIFAFGDDCIAVKSEYRCSNGLIGAFIIDSGEQFWGGAKTAKEQNALIVQPLAIEEVDAVEVVHGYWHVDDCDSGEPDGYAAFIEVHCSKCGYDLGTESGQYGWSYGDPFPLIYCPNCGAKMDGD